MVVIPARSAQMKADGSSRNAVCALAQAVVAAMEAKVDRTNLQSYLELSAEVERVFGLLTSLFSLLALDLGVVNKFTIY